MRFFIGKVVGAVVIFVVGLALFGAFKSVDTVQRGYPGTGMEQVVSKATQAAQLKANTVPPAFPAAAQDGQLAAVAYKNVKVLGHLTTGEFTRLMTAVTTWVAPEQGCAYCHKNKPDAEGNLVADEDQLWSDDLYTKVVARRMFQMTMHINADWKNHVQDTGVTCYTCHRGQNVPAKIWFEQPENHQAMGLVGNKAGQNDPSPVAAWASLPTDYSAYLEGSDNIRVISDTALPNGNRSSIKETEWTYGLMMHMSDSLGVNCTYCHNTRSMADWGASSPARVTAWYGIRMVRDLNNDYLDPLKPTYPSARLGPTGDAPKANCATCHQGAFKPLLGASMLKDYLVLAAPHEQPVIPPPAPAAPVTPPVPGAPAAPPPTGHP